MPTGTPKNGKRNVNQAFRYGGSGDDRAYRPADERCRWYASKERYVDAVLDAIYLNQLKQSIAEDAKYR